MAEEVGVGTPGKRWKGEERKKNAMSFSCMLELERSGRRLGFAFLARSRR
jgi:hypothetical protein